MSGISRTPHHSNGGLFRVECFGWLPSWVIPAATNPPTRLPSTYPPTMPPTPLLPETSLPTVEEIDITLVPSVLPVRFASLVFHHSPIALLYLWQEPSRAISQHAVLASAFIPVAVSFCVILGCQ